MAVSAAILLIPAALLLLRGRKKPAGPQGLSPEQQRAWDEYRGGWSSKDESIAGSEDGLPLSDRMLLNSDCSGPAGKAIKWRYDARITNYYWYLRRELEVEDPVAITAEILHYDSPQCQWPPDPNYGSDWAWIIWEGTYQAVQTYFDLEQSGDLWDYAVDPLDPMARMSVKPLVVWAT